VWCLSSVNEFDDTRKLEFTFIFNRLAAKVNFMDTKSSVSLGQLSELLLENGCILSVAEAQGVLCAVQSLLDDNSALPLWIEQLFEEDAIISTVLEAELAEAYSENRRQMNDADYGLALWLPDMDQSLSDRVLAIGQWCQSYLFGLGVAGFNRGADLSEEGQEFLRDAAEIARIGLTTEDQGDDADTDLFELAEFVRMGVRLIYDELRPELPPTKH
jgi:uncharacterized protein YgfB (UPF0149 family)